MRLSSGWSGFSFFGVLVICLTLSGCATKNNYGNFIQDEQITAQIQLAKDSAKQLETLYPPAKTHLALQQDTPDAFGKALVVALREAGFAVQEWDNYPSKLKTIPPSKETLLPVNPDDPVQLTLSYILDQAGETGLYHLTLLLNHQSLTRLYRLDDNRFIEAGDLVWKKE